VARFFTSAEVERTCDWLTEGLAPGDGRNRIRRTTSIYRESAGHRSEISFWRDFVQANQLIPGSGKVSFITVFADGSHFVAIDTAFDTSTTTCTITILDSFAQVSNLFYAVVRKCVQEARVWFRMAYLQVVNLAPFVSSIYVFHPPNDLI